MTTYNVPPESHQQLPVNSPTLPGFLIGGGEGSQILVLTRRDVVHSLTEDVILCEAIEEVEIMASSEDTVEIGPEVSESLVVCSSIVEDVTIMELLEHVTIEPQLTENVEVKES